MKKHIAYGEIDQNGNPRAYDKQSVIDWSRKNKSKRMKITYEIIGDPKETSQQRGYYRGVVIPNINMGLRNRGYRMSEDQVHEFLRQNSKVRNYFVDIEEKTMHQIDSTSDFDMDDWTQYIDEVIQYAAEELNIVVPDPISPDDRIDLTKTKKHE